MAKVTLLFYRATGNPRATLLDKLVAWIDGGIFSHVEMVTKVDGYLVETIGCHLFRGGVSRGYYDTRMLCRTCDASRKPTDEEKITHGIPPIPPTQRVQL